MKRDKTDYIIIHCSASDVPEHDDIETIRKWHLQRGWDDVGYHYFIDKSGYVYPGRHIDEVGAHCKGYNYRSIGICLSGNVLFKPAQFHTLKKLLHNLSFLNAQVFSHRNFNSSKTCPNFCLEYLLEIWGV